MINKKPLKFTAIFSILFLLTLNVFGQVDVPRRTKAITYPLNEKVTVQFRGTTRFPAMKGDAKIKRTKKNGTEISLKIQKMPRPFELGAGYATYVLWAISPNGQIDNLGEIKRRGFFEFDSRISVTTPLQTFALIITAEPHFLVSRPSREIMLENLKPYSSKGRSIATTTTIQYFGNTSNYFRDARPPEVAMINYRKTPPAILQAKQAIALAKYAGAERDARKELQQAQTYLQNAENGWRAGRDEEYIDISARKAISTAVQAEKTALARKNAREKRNIKLRQDAELRNAEDKYDAAQKEIADLRQALADETRSRELSERDKINYLDQIRDLKAENKELRQKLQDSQLKLATVEAKQEVYEKEKARQKKLTDLQTKLPALLTSLKRFGKVSETNRGIVLTLAENYWEGIRVSSFNQDNEGKLNSLAEVFVNSPDYKIAIESHTDDRGTPEELQVLTNERSQAIYDKLMSLGVAESRLTSKGFGSTMPIASNATRINRSKNRRVQLILTPSIE